MTDTFTSGSRTCCAGDLFALCWKNKSKGSYTNKEGNGHDNAANLLLNCLYEGKYLYSTSSTQQFSDIDLLIFTMSTTSDGTTENQCNKKKEEKLSEKNEEPYHTTITWIRTLLFFEILKSVHGTCVRGCRTPFHKIPQWNFIDYCRLNAISILGSF